MSLRNITQAYVSNLYTRLQKQIPITDKKFNNLKEQKLEKADFNAKLKKTLTIENEMTFNKRILKKFANSSILLKQKDQKKKLELITENKDNYLKQRARAAYIASLYQPEAIFDLSTAAQIQQKDLTLNDITFLNKRIT
ncbi:hypothetical protein MBM_09634 [Drepanopeziza brunnea f. sp. 'multigermtubi' MB_m1]|uniref:Uncharacterized protein n=1 Tax=Marssonina brunnea f. sp. multigermtubi (strain MB_m1) TaxID=1072389 RepID=K1XIE2_MARBU|nr:uncharacterized protein MBM_09634 [Drepanopeziza brunnea f. sp. 'multigermtubi' MB_m1]EKD12199.1 hypothetical protein MBM_09634 [Drepanopeziza brunnea f. sp. 'multigermtubi' MB_m1]